MSVFSAAQDQHLRNAITNKPEVLIFSDGGDDRTFGHVTSDAAGNFYIAAELGAPHRNNSFGVLKYSPQGHLLGAFHFNPKQLSNGFAQDVKVDSAGNIYACGFTFPFGGLVISFDPSGRTRWTRFIGDDRFSSMSLDRSGNIYVGGDSAGGILAAKLTTEGKVLWKTQHEGVTTRRAGVTDLQLDSKGNIVIIGDTGNSEFLQQTTVLKLDPHGKILWARDFNDFPGTNKVPQGGAVDHSDGIYATGTALNTFTGEATPYTVKYDTNGNFQFLLTDAGNGGTAVKVDPAGNILLEGATSIQGEFVSTVSNITPSGKALWVTQVPTIGRLTNDLKGNIYVSGLGFSGQDAPGWEIIKLNPAGTILFTFNRPMPKFLSLDTVTDAIFDPFGNLLATGFGLPNDSGVDDIIALKLPKDFKPSHH